MPIIKGHCGKNISKSETAIPTVIDPEKQNILNKGSYLHLMLLKFPNQTFSISSKGKL